ncbi:MAG TPA: glycosyl hydrolase [Gammaproteobacteria bacterium]|nr:glycosyl hydrolase [Gammaproteobacteria bacterium]
MPIYPDSALQALSWRLIGPFRGGRVIAVAGVAEQPSTFYAGGADGGIWKTTDAGYDWVNVSDCCLKVGAVGALAVAPSDPNIVYAGTGESYTRGDMATGDGMWKSIDAGKTWTHVGLDATRVIAKIVIDSHNPAHLYVAALGHVFGPNPERGVFESSDGGATWQRVLYVDNNTGAVDISMAPDNPDVLYAAMWQVERKPWHLESGGPGGGIYKSTDSGAHWTNLSHQPGLPAGPLGKIGIAVSAAAPHRVYALIEAHAGGLFRSEDDGKTWQRMYHKADITQRAFYFSSLYANPQNADDLYAPQAAGLMISKDGGKTFKSRYARGGDNHVMWINPEHPEDMIVGNDGGATITRDGGTSWSELDNQPLAQFYHVAVDDQFPFHLYGAQQDGATFEVTSRDTTGYSINPDAWHIVAQWEDGYAVPMPGQPWITYTGGGFAGLLERFDSRTKQKAFLGPWPEDATGHPAANLKYRFQWVFPVMISQHAPHAIYLGYQCVMKSADGGMSWQEISPDLTRNDKSKQQLSGGPITIDATSVEYYDTVFALAESPLHAGLLWAGTDDGKVWVTRDDGKHWRNVTPPGLPEWATVNTIDASHFDAGTAWLSARRYRQDDYSPYLYVTHDYGRHWQKIVNGLPNDESSFVIRQDIRDPNLLFAGTLRGVYVSFNSGEDWQPLQLNLPHSAVRDIAVQPQANALAIATHGRGFWVLDNIEPLRELSHAALQADAFLITPQTAWLTGGQQDLNAARYHSGLNPSNGLSVFYLFKQTPNKSVPVTLSFTDTRGNVLAKYSSTAAESSGMRIDAVNPGLNLFIWDLRYHADVTLSPDEMPVATGPRVVPGTYQVTLTVGNRHFIRSFNIYKDPRSPATPADLQMRYTLLRDIQDEQIRIATTLQQIDALHDELTKLQATVSDAASRRHITDLLSELEKIDTTLAEPSSESYLAGLQQPTGIQDRLGTITFAAEESLIRPATSDIQVWKTLKAEFEVQSAKLKHIEEEMQAVK